MAIKSEATIVAKAFAQNQMISRTLQAFLLFPAKIFVFSPFCQRFQD